MNALFKFSSLSVLLICLSLVACTDHQEPGAERLRIKKLTRSLPYQHGYSVVSVLGYDWQGRLDSVYSYQTADSAHSPTSGIFSHYTYCGGVDNFLHMSRNNPTSSNIKGYTQTLYRYQYNTHWLPESRVTLVKPMLDLPAVLSETLLFEYEIY
jgi:hypothetical protein